MVSIKTGSREIQLAWLGGFKLHKVFLEEQQQ